MNNQAMYDQVAKPLADALRSLMSGLAANAGVHPVCARLSHDSAGESALAAFDRLPPIPQDNSPTPTQEAMYRYQRQYRGFTIRIKRDFGSAFHLIDGMPCLWGYVVLDPEGGYLALPGAVWFQTVKQAQAGIDAWLESEGNAERFWEILRASAGSDPQRNSEQDSVPAGFTIRRVNMGHGEEILISTPSGDGITVGKQGKHTHRVLYALSDAILGQEAR